MHGSYPLASPLPAIILAGVLIYGFLILTGNAGASKRLSLPFWVLILVVVALLWLMSGLNPFINSGSVHLGR